MSQPPFIPVCEPYLCGKELDYVKEAITTNWISSSGSYVTRLENEFASYVGAQHGVTTTSGTTALHLACKALELGPGDEVIVPNFTMIASAFAVCYTGAMPVFVDSEAETWNIDPNLIEEKITPNTKAIMVTHIYGHPCEMDTILQIAKKHNLKVIEDAAEVHGATYKGKPCGSLGDIACFSLFANKIITSGEGGLITTNDKVLFDKCRYYRNLCFPLDGPRNYVHEDIGYNYRLPNTLAAIAVAQLENIGQLIERRIANAHCYQEMLKEVPGLRFQPKLDHATNVYWMVSCCVDENQFGCSRDQLMVDLKSRGIDTRKLFYPMHRQPALAKYGCAVEGQYPVTDKLSVEGLYFPSSSGLTRDLISYICDQIKEVHNKYK